MTSSSITDFLISVSFLSAGGYALWARLRRVAGTSAARDQHEVIPRGGHRGGDGPRSVEPR
ncbi:MAG: hypothetical protein ABWZ98_10100 [Nakamurella sp.]